jgi:hypothetical protein
MPGNRLTKRQTQAGCPAAQRRHAGTVGLGLQSGIDLSAALKQNRRYFPGLETLHQIFVSEYPLGHKFRCDFP